MTASTNKKIPDHLRRYIVEQNYARYTPEDQAVWRYILRQLKSYLSVHAHESYSEGLVKTGITVESIPRIEDIDRALEKFGWGAVPVSGFIPPAAFMEFQSIGVLPIASDMRSLDHLLYTPAPDIVHEAAGHAPILVHPEYAAYLRQYGEVACHSIINKEDLDQYDAIRVLSDVKEDPRSTPEEVRRAEQRLIEVNRSLVTTSEAALLSRMNWWTAEYGLIGRLESPRIFGAGLLSSVGEAKACLNPEVKKIPLSVDCVNFSYDITEPQPQLFVARDFHQLGEVLEQLSKQLSYRKGGTYGLERAKEARTVNTVTLDSDLQISGILTDWITSESDGKTPVYLQFSGPSQLAFNRQELPGQGMSRHPQGFSSPLGRLKGDSRDLFTYKEPELGHIGVSRGRRAELEFASGIIVKGLIESYTFASDRLVILTWSDCKVTMGSRTLFDPSWGAYDMTIGGQVTSVSGGPADRARFGKVEEFAARKIPPRQFSPDEQRRHASYQGLRDLRQSKSSDIPQLNKLMQEYLSEPGAPWLIGMELYELALRWGLGNDQLTPLIARLEPEKFDSQNIQDCIRSGLAIAHLQL